MPVQLCANIKNFIGTMMLAWRKGNIEKTVSVLLYQSLILV